MRHTDETIKAKQKQAEVNASKQYQPNKQRKNRYVANFPTDGVDIEELGKESEKELEEWKMLLQVIKAKKEEADAENKAGEETEVPQEKVEEEIQINIIDSDLIEEESETKQQTEEPIKSRFEEDDVDLEELVKIAENQKEENAKFNQVLAEMGHLKKEKKEEPIDINFINADLSEEELKIQQKINEKYYLKKESKLRAKEIKSKQPVPEHIDIKKEEESKFKNINTDVKPREIEKLERPTGNFITNLQSDKAEKKEKKKKRKEDHVAYKANLKTNLNSIKVDGDMGAIFGEALGVLKNNLDFDKKKNMKMTDKDKETYQLLSTMKDLLQAYLEPKRKETDGKSMHSISKLLLDVSYQLTLSCVTVETYKYHDIADEIHSILDEEMYGKLNVEPIKSIKKWGIDNLIPASLFKSEESLTILEKIKSQIRYSRGLGKVLKNNELFNWSEKVFADIENFDKELGFSLDSINKTNINPAEAKQKIFFISEEIKVLKSNFNTTDNFLSLSYDKALNSLYDLYHYFNKVSLDREKYLYEKNNGLFIEEKYNSKAVVKQRHYVEDSQGNEIERKVKEVDVIDCRHMPLFPAPPCLEDIQQRAIGDCFLLAGIAACLNTNPELPKEMMRDNGDTVTVRFFRQYNSDCTDIRPIYVTVQKNTIEHLSGVFWVQMIEKAYAVAKMNHEFAASALGKEVGDENFYDMKMKEGKVNYVNLSGGQTNRTIMHLTGKVNSLQDVANKEVFTANTLTDALATVLTGKNRELHEQELMTLINRGNVNAVSADDVHQLMTLLEDTKKLHTKKVNGQKLRVDPDSLDDVRILLEADKSIKYQGATEIERAKSKEYAILRITEVLFNSSASRLTHSVGHENGYSKGAMEKFWAMKEAIANKIPVIANSTSYMPQGGSEYKREGIAETHAYSVVKCVEDGDRRFVVVHNPWGSKYGRTYKLNWNNKLVRQESKSSDSSTKGLSFIDLNDFMKSFREIGI